MAIGPKGQKGFIVEAGRIEVFVWIFQFRRGSSGRPGVTIIRDIGA